MTLLTSSQNRHSRCLASLLRPPERMCPVSVSLHHGFWIMAGEGGIWLGQPRPRVLACANYCHHPSHPIHASSFSGSFLSPVLIPIDCSPQTLLLSGFHLLSSVADTSRRQKDEWRERIPGISTPSYSWLQHRSVVVDASLSLSGSLGHPSSSLCFPPSFLLLWVSDCLGPLTGHSAPTLSL